MRGPSLSLLASLAAAFAPAPASSQFLPLPIFEPVLKGDPTQGTHVYMIPGTAECEDEAEKACLSIVRKCQFGTGRNVNEEGDDCEVQCLAKNPPVLSDKCIKTHPCAKDVETFCADAAKGTIMHCLHSKRAQLSTTCLNSEPCFGEPNFREGVCAHLHPSQSAEDGGAAVAGQPHHHKGKHGRTRFHRTHHGAGGGGLPNPISLFGSLFGGGGSSSAQHPAEHHFDNSPHCECLDECGPHIHDALCEPCNEEDIHPEGVAPGLNTAAGDRSPGAHAGGPHVPPAEEYMEEEESAPPAAVGVTSVHAHGIPVTTRKAHVVTTVMPAAAEEHPTAADGAHEGAKASIGHGSGHADDDDSSGNSNSGGPPGPPAPSYEEGQEQQQHHQEQQQHEEPTHFQEEAAYASHAEEQQHHEEPPAVSHEGEAAYHEEEAAASAPTEGDAAVPAPATAEQEGEAAESHAGSDDDGGSSSSFLEVQQAPSGGVGESHPLSAADVSAASRRHEVVAGAAAAPQHHEASTAGHEQAQQHQQYHGKQHHQHHGKNKKKKKACVRNPVCGLNRNWCRVSPECNSPVSHVADIRGCHGPYHGHKHKGCEAAIMSRLADKDNHPAPAVPQHVHDRVHKEHHHKHGKHGKHHKHHGGGGNGGDGGDGGAGGRMGEAAAVEARKKHALDHIQRELHRCHIQEQLSHPGEGKICPKPSASQWNAAHSGPLDRSSLTHIKTCAPPPPFVSFIRHFFDGLTHHGNKNNAPHPHPQQQQHQEQQQGGQHEIAQPRYHHDEIIPPHSASSVDAAIGSHHPVDNTMGKGSSNKHFAMSSHPDALPSSHASDKHLSETSQAQARLNRERQRQIPSTFYGRRSASSGSTGSTGSGSSHDGSRFLASSSSTALLSYLVPNSVLLNKAANDILVLYAVYFALAVLVALCLACCWVCVVARRSQAFDKNSPYRRVGACALGLGAIVQGCLGRLCLCARICPSVFGEKREGLPSNFVRR